MSLRFCSSIFFLAGLSLAACAAEDLKTESTPVCPAIVGDKHVEKAESSPGKIPTMLHVVGRECVVTGANDFHLYGIGTTEGTKPMTAMALEPSAMVKDDTLTVTAVEAVMPSMGHGTAEAPVLKGKGEFSVNFQMPGEWQLTIAFSSPTTTDAQSVVIPVLVR
jgi:hypothetical protein